MVEWEAVVFGAIGGLVTGALGAVAYLKGVEFKIPQAARSQVLGYTLVQVLLAGLGALASFALFNSGEISGYLGAVSAGIAAPEILRSSGKALAGRTQGGNSNGN